MLSQSVNGINLELVLLTSLDGPKIWFSLLNNISSLYPLFCILKIEESIAGPFVLKNTKVFRVLNGFGKVFVNKFLNFSFNIEKIFYITSILPPLLMTEVSSILSLLILLVLPFDLNLLVNTIVCSLHMVSKNSCNAFVWSLLPC